MAANNITGKEQIRNMFNNIAGRYDFLNHFLSLGIDRYWRKQVVKVLKPYKPEAILDVAAGTGDLSVQLCSLNPRKITGIDISEKMLEAGRKKINKKKLNNIIELISGDAENIPFPDNTFDATVAAFGVRNFENTEKGLKEMNRVIKNNGKIVILEFSGAGTFPFNHLYNFYFRRILPLIGKIISGDKSAYSYLPDSVRRFPERDGFLRLLENCSFKNTYYKSLTFGIVSIYVGEKS